MILLSFVERLNNRLTAVCQVYGNVPYFYFIVHLCVLRLINIILILAQGLPTKSDVVPVWQVSNFGYPLWAVYLFWILVVALLFFPVNGTEIIKGFTERGGCLMSKML